MGGQLVYVAEKEDEFQARMAILIPDSESYIPTVLKSNLLLRSLQCALYKDEAGRRLTVPLTGPLFSETWDWGCRKWYDLCLAELVQSSLR
ncbi:hypothetical protein OB236_30875 [Paenibacillus sp. WQ 127069]|uniref:Uncharacterized protein n=1 Tax=Paenibacillus baimaensis TaxID=2982185 RepID=A0ABT2UPQ9_9BACL|nr:hypothetical protein [Paenibacillus sp. WQ 127069]MCU6796537.1 hypothetical protein [Paenibacillus sp. WQ 127069]